MYVHLHGKVMEHQTSAIPALALAFRSSSLRNLRSEIQVVKALYAGDLAGVEQTESFGALARATFFGSADILSATLGRIHPYLRTGEIHPSTSDGLRSLIRHLDFGKPKLVTRITAQVLEGSAAILGGPVANLHARLVMGCGGVSPLFGVKLPITFHCPKLDAKSLKNVVEPWSVFVEGRSSKKECLVLTSVPMGDSNQDRLTIFSGLHGAGTRAIELVLQDERLLERIYRATKAFLGWQIIIEVGTRDTHTPNSIGDFKAYETIGIDFDDPQKQVRKRLHLEYRQIKALIDMLPPEQEVDLTDPSNTGVIKLDEHKLWKKRHHGKLVADQTQRRSPSSAASNSPHQPGPRRLNAPSARSRALREPRQSNEANMNPTALASINLAKTVKRRPGRPLKEKSEATLTRRFGLLLTNEDLNRLEEVMRYHGLGSMGQAIRDIIRKEHQSLLHQRSGKVRK